jgi:hypothetical protein
MEVPAGQAQHAAMTQNLLVRNASLVFGLMITASAASPSTNPAEVRLAVRVHDYANLPAGARDEITANAKRVLRQAGVSAEFVLCFRDGAESGAPTCNGPLGPADLVLRILEPKLAVRSEQLGYAAMTPEGGGYITVFVNPTQRRARIDTLSDGIFLGYAVAHEIGHLLLGANSHSSSGVMRSLWRPCDEEWMARGVLLFETAQARQMQLAVAERSRK